MTVHTILIYIPSHSDLPLALKNIELIRESINFRQDLRGIFQVLISLSINGIELTAVEIENIKDIVDDFNYIKSNISGDTNILQGYVKALEIGPDYLWILSANEILQSNFLENLYSLILGNLEIDIFIASGGKTLEIRNVTNIFLELRKHSGVGLISSTIYKFKSTSDYFFIGNKFHWTGWGHLAVIQQSLSSNANFTIIEYPGELLYKHGDYFDNQNRSWSLEINRIKYHDSFFSLPILASYFMIKNKKEFTAYYWFWLKEVWLKINYFRFREGDPIDPTKVINPIWIEKYFLLTIKANNLLLYFLTRLIYVLPIYKFQKFKILKLLYGKYIK